MLPVNNLRIFKHKDRVLRMLRNWIKYEENLFKFMIKLLPILLLISYLFFYDFLYFSAFNFNDPPIYFHFFGIITAMFFLSRY